MKDKLIDFIDDMTFGDGIDKFLGWLCILLICVFLISGILFCIGFPYVLITRDPNQISSCILMNIK